MKMRDMCLANTNVPQWDFVIGGTTGRLSSSFHGRFLSRTHSRPWAWGKMLSPLLRVIICEPALTRISRMIVFKKTYSATVFE